MSKKATEFQRKAMSRMYRGKEIFKPLNTGWAVSRSFRWPATPAWGCTLQRSSIFCGRRINPFGWSASYPMRSRLPNGRRSFGSATSICSRDARNWTASTSMSSLTPSFLAYQRIIKQSGVVLAVYAPDLADGSAEDKAVSYALALGRPVMLFHPETLETKWLNVPTEKAPG